MHWLTCTPSVTAENFDYDYLQINPNGTVPSLTSPHLSKPLTESFDILRYLDGLKGNSTLVPSDPAVQARVKAILEVVHSNDVTTNLILLQARDHEELKSKTTGLWGTFVANRQAKLEQGKVEHPEFAFYSRKADENGALHTLYTTAGDAEQHKFFAVTDEMYRTFAAGMAKLESLLVLPYAAGSVVTEADWHVVPWLSHAMAGAGTDPKAIQDFAPLEALIGKSVPGFVVGPKTKKWWAAISATDAFKTVFPVLH